MDITIYLPDELGKWAKDNDLGLSRMLREAVTDEKNRSDAAAGLAAEATTHLLDVCEPNGYSTDDYTARLHGTLIAGQDIPGYGAINVYTGKDGKIYIHHTGNGNFHRDVDLEDLQEHVDVSTYIEAMRALGQVPVIDVGLPE